jgi:hypothetical protein
MNGSQQEEVVKVKGSIRSIRAVIGRRVYKQRRSIRK